MSIRTRLDETKPLINAVRLATAAVYVEGPPSILEPAKRVEERLVLFHTAMTALVTGPSDASVEFAAAYRATCAQQRVGVRNALMDFASAARSILDGDSRPVPLEQPAPTQDSAEDLSYLLSAMASALGEEQLTLDADKTLWENGFNSLLIMRIVNILHRDHGWDLDAVWFFEMGDQSVRQMAGHLAALRTSGSIPAARWGDSRQRHLD
ncbi:acyl carrier protein [Streptomyces sp. DH7]|uniref:acyl carrier protein n=1 Tax=Streptomyces sp. DH7 TaxID=2857006 RepID=UPI001E4E049B|nr:acyl carrier protein [Streptomyces sp. DH7]